LFVSANICSPFGVTTTFEFVVEYTSALLPFGPVYEFFVTQACGGSELEAEDNPELEAEDNPELEAEDNPELVPELEAELVPELEAELYDELLLLLLT